MNSNKFVFFSKRPQLNDLCHVVLQTSSDNIEGCQLQVNILMKFSKCLQFFVYRF